MLGEKERGGLVLVLGVVLVLLFVFGFVFVDVIEGGTGCDDVDWIGLDWVGRVQYIPRGRGGPCLVLRAWRAVCDGLRDA